jgi:hypothetical protein
MNKHFKNVVILNICLVVFIINIKDIMGLAMSETSGSSAASGEEEQNIKNELAHYNITFNQKSLIDGLKHKDDFARIFSAKALGLIGDYDALNPLKEYADKSDMYNSVRAIKSINSIIQRTFRPTIEKIKKSDLDYDKFMAADCLCDIGDTSHYDIILKIIRNPVKNSLLYRAVKSVPCYSKYAFYENGKNINWVQELSLILDKENIDRDNKLNIIRILSEIDTNEAIDILKNKLIKEKDYITRSLLVRILQKYDK